MPDATRSAVESTADTGGVPELPTYNTVAGMLFFLQNSVGT
jgi:hypothetical protein